MKTTFLGISLILLACLFTGCEGFDKSNETGTNKITRIYLSESDGSQTGNESVFDYRYAYDHMDRVARVAIERDNSHSNGENAFRVSENYVYSYIDFDSVAILRQVLLYGGNALSTEGYYLNTLLDANGRVVSIEDSVAGLRMEYTYDSQSRLNGLTKRWFNDSAQSTFHVDIQWTKEGNMETITAGNITYYLEYGEAPLVNTLNIDLLGWLLEQEFMENIPLWSVGLQGPTNRNMPSALSIGSGSTRIRIQEYSYTAQKGNIASFTVTDARSGHADTFVIETTSGS